jgi:hypothetical protein
MWLMKMDANGLYEAIDFVLLTQFKKLCGINIWRKLTQCPCKNNLIWGHKQEKLSFKYKCPFSTGKLVQIQQNIIL